MCRLYVSYVRRTNDVITGGEKARGIVVQAFEFAVTKVGIDIKSGDLWNDYLEFLKAWTPAATWEQQQKVDLIRRVYKRFLVIPTEKIEQVWSTYTKWENEVNASTANKFIAEKSSEFMDARSWNTEWHNATERLLRRDVIPIGINNDKNNLVHTQLELWYKWVALEKQNKLNLKDESLIQQRIEYVYKQAVMALPFVPELWFKFNKFWLRSNEEANSNKCIELLKEGIVLNPKSFLLTFQLSEMYEKDNAVDKATQTFDNLISILMNDHNEIRKAIELIKSRESPNGKNNQENSEEKKSNMTDNSDVDNDDDDDDEDNVSHPLFQLSEEDAVHLIELQSKEEQLSKAITLVYTKLMLACKRSKGIKEARSIFKQARNNFDAIGHEFYVENALMEYHSDNLKTASKIFELGMKHFKKQGEFLLAYLDFLIMINKDESIKVLFEQGLTALLQDMTIENEGHNGTITSHTILQESKNKENAKKKNCIKKLIKKFSRYQSVYGDLDLIKSLDSRYEEYFPDDDSIELFSDRYRGHSIDVIKQFDLGNVDVEETDLNSMKMTKKRKIQPPAVDELTSEIPNKAVNTNSIDAVQTQLQPQNFVGNTVYNLLRVLPNASYFGPPSDHLFNNGKLVELFSNLPNVPTE